MWESTGLLSVRQAWWMGLIFAVLLPVIAMEPVSYYLCLAWSCSLAEQLSSLSPHFCVIHKQPPVWFSFKKGVSICCNDAWFCLLMREKGAYQNITIIPCWCSGTKALTEGDRGRDEDTLMQSCTHGNKTVQMREIDTGRVNGAFLPVQCHQQHSRSRLSLVFCTPPRPSQSGQRLSERRAPGLLASSPGQLLDPRPRSRGVRLLFQCLFPGPLFPD